MTKINYNKYQYKVNNKQTDRIYWLHRFMNAFYPTHWEGPNYIEDRLNGYLGEFAFTKLFDIGFEWDPEKQLEGHDCILYNKKVNVKTTRHYNGTLNINTITKNNCDVYALMTGEDGNYTFKGFISKNNTINSKYLTDGHGNTQYYKIPQSELSLDFNCAFI